MEHFDTRRAFIAGSAITALSLIGASGAVVAQDESPEATAAAAHPLHIHSGTCDQLGDVVFPFGFISEDLMVHGEAADGEELGTVTDQDVALNVTIVDATIGDLTASDHAINIHESEEALDINIACADIGGTLIEGDTLVLRIEPTDDSGYLGFALLQEGEEGQTTVYTMLTQVETAATPAEEPPAEEASAEPSMDAGAEPSMEASLEPSAEASMDAEPSADASAEPSMDADMSAEPIAEASVEPSDGDEESPEASPAG